MTEREPKNFVLQAKSDQFFWEGTGQLSIKTFSRGSAHYKTNKGFFAVEENRYILLNEGDYTISIEDTCEVESFCLFFKRGFAEEVSRCLEESTDNLLSDPYRPLHATGFFEKTYTKNKILGSQLDYFSTNFSSMREDSLWQEEQFHKVMKTILCTQRETWNEVDSMKSMRSSTREELYRRVNVAHDYIRAFYNHPIGLHEISRIACMSPNHLLKNYSQLFGRTPHQHMTKLRISKAKQLLNDTNSSVTDIAFEIGFNNSSSFSKMFKQFTGTSPMQYRKK
ncbi:helix-turn-helix domain-containing protein [Sporosarcina limicola]|uniref:AraC-like DNA-binding protein n=1 Tax=Sporosarcina limicola TaxID=34101 RepID=A0A927MKQ9_9BACL|nr:AraC family transcriptional regulator [Sporosarcina limicola]MBE1553344.1 AraC-like DNA-binding protein [Sporosarcina limicola]